MSTPLEILEELLSSLLDMYLSIRAGKYFNNFTCLADRAKINHSVICPSCINKLQISFDQHLNCEKYVFNCVLTRGHPSTPC